MNNTLIQKLEAQGFTVNNRGHVYKHSKTTRRKEIAGQTNRAGVYFYAQNVAPFQQGQNTFKDILGSNISYIPYTPPAKEIEHTFTFEDYKNTTKAKNQFSIFLKKLHKEHYTLPFEDSAYDIRGIKSGYLTDATVFPYINFDNEFVSAKIVKYNTNTGKRIKDKFSNSWFHAYKDIKKELGLKEKISKGIDCFFGEHLLAHNNKPVVIVEAEKTAIILSMFYKNIVFIASGGLGKLKTLKHDFLHNRDVYVFPDNGALEWFKIANKRGWWISRVLQDKGTEGSDAVDYLTSNKKDPGHKSLWWELHRQFFEINFQKLEAKEDAGLNFSLKTKPSFKYCIPNLMQIGLNYYKDFSVGRAFIGSNFAIYKKKFQVLNANIDFNKYQFVKGKYIPVDEKEFLRRLEKCFRIAKHLNQENDIKKEFSKVLTHLLEHSNFLFNRKYIINELLPVWDNGANDVTEYYKKRNWRFKSKKHIEDKEFQKLLNNDLKAYSTNKLLLKVLPLIEKRKYIKANDIGLNTKQKNSFVWDLIKEYNKKVLGCSTINNYNKKIELNKYFNFVNELTNELEPNAKLYNNSCSTYYNTNIGCKKKCTTFKIPSIQTIHDNTLIHKNTIREFLNFRPDNDAVEAIETTVNYIIDNPLELHFERVNKRIEIKASKTVKEMKELLCSTITNKQKEVVSAQDAFNYELDLTDSILHVDELEAIERGGMFLYSWILFHYKELTQYEKEMLYFNPMDFIMSKNLRLSA